MRKGLKPLTTPPGVSAYEGHDVGADASGMQLLEASHQPHLVSPAERVVQSPQLVYEAQNASQVSPSTLTSIAPVSGAETNDTLFAATEYEPTRIVSRPTTPCSMVTCISNSVLGNGPRTRPSVQQVPHAHVKVPLPVDRSHTLVPPSVGSSSCTNAG